LTPSSAICTALMPSTRSVSLLAVPPPPLSSAATSESDETLVPV
jgi:hypothetical protein